MQDLLNETTSKLNDVVIINGYEQELNDSEYLWYLQKNHKSIPMEVLEEL